MAKQAEREKLIKKACEGDQAAADAYFADLTQNGGSIDAVSDILVAAHTDPFKARFGQDLIMLKAFRNRAARMRKDLGFEEASALERLLIHRIVHCWFHVSDVEATYQRCTAQTMSLEKAMYFEKALDRAQKRYTSAIQSLAIVRRLQIPAVQLNIGEKQVNVVLGAGPLPALEAGAEAASDRPS